MFELIQRLDEQALRWIAETLRTPLMDKVFSLYTFLGNGGWAFILAGLVLLFFRKTRKTGLGMGFALILGLLICNVTLKPLVGRIRPYDYQLEHFGKTIELLVGAQHDFSFPSGHTIASFEAAFALLLHNKKLGIPAMILAVLIAFSRLYLYVHYPTDVIASVILGIGLAILATWIVGKLWDLAVQKMAQKKQA